MFSLYIENKKINISDYVTFVSSNSEVNPSPYTVFALGSDHCPNFCDVFVNVIPGDIVLLIIA